MVAISNIVPKATNSMEIVSESEILQEMKDLFHNQPITILNVQEI